MPYNLLRKYPIMFAFGEGVQVSHWMTEKRKKTDNLKAISLFWSEWRDLHSRRLDPESSALPTAPHPDNEWYNIIPLRILQVFFYIFLYFLQNFGYCFASHYSTVVCCFQRSNYNHNAVPIITHYALRITHYELRIKIVPIFCILHFIFLFPPYAAGGRILQWGEYLQTEL